MSTQAIGGSVDSKWTKDSNVNLHMMIQIEDGTIPYNMKGVQILELANSTKKEHAMFRIYRDYSIAVISKHLREIRKIGNDLLTFFRLNLRRPLNN